MSHHPVAVCCSVLQCVAVCRSVWRCVAVCCNVLQCVAVWCSVLQCVAVCCSVCIPASKPHSSIKIHSSSSGWSMLECVAVHCNVLMSQHPPTQSVWCMLSVLQIICCRLRVAVSCGVLFSQSSTRTHEPESPN